MHRSEKILRGIDNQYYRATYKVRWLHHRGPEADP